VHHAAPCVAGMETQTGAKWRAVRERLDDLVSSQHMDEEQRDLVELLLAKDYTADGAAGLCGETDNARLVRKLLRTLPSELASWVLAWVVGCTSVPTVSCHEQPVVTECGTVVHVHRSPASTGGRGGSMTYFVGCQWKLRSGCSLAHIHACQGQLVAFHSNASMHDLRAY
jgi:hypothetical protein